MSQTLRVSVCASVRARVRASLSLCVGYCAVPAVLLPGWLGLAWLVPVPVCSVRRSVAKLLYTYFFRVFFFCVVGAAAATETSCEQRSARRREEHKQQEQQQQQQ